MTETDHIPEEGGGGADALSAAVLDAARRGPRDALGAVALIAAMLRARLLTPSARAWLADRLDHIAATGDPALLTLRQPKHSRATAADLMRRCERALDGVSRGERARVYARIAAETGLDPGTVRTQASLARKRFAAALGANAAAGARLDDLCARAEALWNLPPGAAARMMRRHGPREF